jgi:hypothetical protein
MLSPIAPSPSPRTPAWTQDPPALRCSEQLPHGLLQLIIIVSYLLFILAGYLLLPILSLGMAAGVVPLRANGLRCS